MRHAPLCHDRGASGLKPLGGDFQRLFDHFGRETWQHGRDHADFPHAIGRDAKERLCNSCKRRIPRGAGDREGNDLHRRDHLAGDHRLIGGQRRERDRLVDPVEPVDRILVDDQHARGLREQISAPGEGAIDVNALPRYASAISAAATSSDTSPGSSRATTMSSMPAASKAATSWGPISVPFLRTSSSCRMVWTAVAPTAFWRATDRIS